MFNITQLLEVVMTLVSHELKTHCHNMCNGYLICCFRDDAFEEKLTSFISRKADLLFKKKERRSDPPQSFRNEHGTVFLLYSGETTNITRETTQKVVIANGIKIKDCNIMDDSVTKSPIFQGL